MEEQAQQVVILQLFSRHGTDNIRSNTKLFIVCLFMLTIFVQPLRGYSCCRSAPLHASKCRNIVPMAKFVQTCRAPPLNAYALFLMNPFICHYRSFHNVLSYSALGFPASQEVTDLLMSTGKEHALTVVPPDQHTHFLREPSHGKVLLRILELLEQEPTRRLHSFVLQLPETDLIDYRWRQDGFVGQCCGAVHLLVGVSSQVGDDLVGCDAEVDGLTDGGTGESTGDHVWEAHAETAEESEDSDLKC